MAVRGSLACVAPPSSCLCSCATANCRSATSSSFSTSCNNKSLIKATERNTSQPPAAMAKTKINDLMGLQDVRI